jgi:hypothetical protein
MDSTFKTVIAKGAKVTVEIREDGYKTAYLGGGYLTVAPDGHTAHTNLNDDSGLRAQILDAISQA